jgi:hypothetical protein
MDAAVVTFSHATLRLFSVSAVLGKGDTERFLAGRTLLLDAYRRRGRL